MALRSPPSSPPTGTAADANQAIGLLSTVHHWQATVRNSEGRRTVLVTITHAGRRVRQERRTFVDAVNAALQDLRGRKAETPLRLVR